MKEVYLTPNGNKINISHFPGWTRYKYKRLMEKMAKTKIKNVPENLTIMTVVDDDTANYDKSPLINQLKENNIPFINAAEHKDVYPWVNNKKIELICNALKEVKTEYCLILDGIDVVINRDLNHIIDDFKTYNKDIIFNATAWAHPSVEIDVIENRKEIYGTYSYLNAGCCIGNTDALLKFYKEVLKMFKATPEDDEFYSSEQYFVRKVFAKRMKTVFFDYKCKIFQVWHNAELGIPKIDQSTHSIIYKLKQL